MKNQSLKIIFVFGVLILIFAVFGYLKAVPSPPSEQNKFQGPKIVVEPETWDFGEVEFGQVVRREFSVKNEGSKLLEIRRVSTSCGCTKAEVDREKIASGETAKLLVTYDAGAMGKKIIGKRVERFVYIKSNDPVNSQVEITIYARTK